MSLTVIVDSALQAISRLAEAVNYTLDKASYMQDRSLSDVTKLTRVEPLTIVSKDLLNDPIIQDVNQSLLNMFIAYYLQAIAIMTKVSDVEVVRVLDALNPDRDSTGFLLGERVSNESLEYLRDDTHVYRLPGTARIATEAPGDSSSSSGQSLQEVANMSVGKLVNVDINYSKSMDGSESENRKVTIPIQIRLMCSVIPNLSIQHLLSSKTDDTSLTERFHAWRSGRLNFIRDLIFCQDLIKEHKRAMVEDQTGTISEIIRRVNNSKKYGLMTRNPSLASASNLFVISETVAREIESKLGGRLDSYKIRQRAFDNTYAMIICVVDRDWERCTFYINDQRAASDLSFKEIKNGKKSQGPEIMEMMKAMTMGAPSL